VWTFSIYGFFSIACASKPDGSLDRDTVMVRARCKGHLRNLQKRFAALASAEIATMPNRDYRYRLIVPKSVWVATLAEMAEEQTWSNFKNEVARFNGRNAYERALHQVWETMYGVQMLDPEERARDQEAHDEWKRKREEENRPGEVGLGGVRPRSTRKRRE
jgi:hypothetical protein